jgi:hypothetical protein
MSDLVMVTRERWAARSMVVERWHKQSGDTFRRGDLLCELRVDGRLVPVTAQVHETENCSIYWHAALEGLEVPPSGWLLEYIDMPLGPGDRSREPRALALQQAQRQQRRREQYPQIFVSYRRKDSEAYAGRLHEVLCREFGDAQVFLDEFSIRPGEPYTWAIQQAVAHAAVVLCVIGPAWTTITETGFAQRRLDNPSDLLRRELVAAFDRGTPILPLLVQRAAIPRADELPDELRTLADLQAWELSARHWGNDVQNVIGEIRRVLP